MSPLQVPVTATYNTKLNTILDAVMEKIYGTKTTVITEATTAGTLQTCITTGSCAWTYTAQENMTLHEAEADALYQCLRHLTNVLGYKIIDLNHPTLEKLISQLNNWNRHIHQLEICATSAAVYTKEIFHNIVTLHLQLIAKVVEGNIVQLNISMDQFIQDMKKHCDSFNESSRNFKEVKVPDYLLYSIPNVISLILC